MSARPWSTPGVPLQYPLPLQCPCGTVVSAPLSTPAVPLQYPCSTPGVPLQYRGECPFEYPFEYPES